MILGIDEVGRGPWAGPLVVGAVILGGAEIDGLDDSKKLTKKRREALDVEIREKAAAWALGWVSAQELDDIGMSEALRLATRRVVEQIQAQCRQQNLAFSEIIIDGKVNFLRGTALEKFVATIPKADGLIPSVSAASIVAPAAFSTQMMTVWAMGLSTGASLSTLVSNFYREGHESGYFLAIGGVTVAVGCIIFLLSKKLAIGMGFREKQ